MALRKHYLGEQHINQTANAAEAELNSLHYEGNTKGFGWEQYVACHMKCHNILKGLQEHGYHGMDEGTKVRILKKGIKAPFLEAPLAVVNSSDEKYGRDFHAVVAYLGPLVKEHQESVSGSLHRLNIHPTQRGRRRRRPR